MSQYNSPFVVDQLRPEGLGGKAGGVYQLNPASVSPSRYVGRDEVGMPVEETVPTVYFKYLLDPSGNIEKVPMRTASVFSMEPEAERYEQQLTRTLVTEGWIPLELCPHSTEYTHVTRGPFVKSKAGDEDCGGVAPTPNSAVGCKHMQAVTAERRARTLARHRANESKVSQMKTEDVERIQEATAKAFAGELARHFPVDQKTRVANLRSGKGEE